MTDAPSLALDPFALEDAHTLPTYTKPPVALVRGEGVTVWDTEGRSYLDFYGGHCVALLGHCPPSVVAAIQRQAAELLFYSNAMYVPVRAEAAQRLTALAPDGLDHVFFCNSGSEANETALKLARAFTGRAGIVAMEGGFHGRTLGSLATTWGEKYHAPYRDVLPATHFVPFGDADAVEEQLKGGGVAAVILEPIQSMAGIVEAEPAYYQRLRALCDEYGTVLIFDEVQTGVGRTGRFTYGEHVGVTPDLISLAKSLGSGVPVGAVLVDGKIAESVKSGAHGSTFGGGPLAAAAVAATLDTLVADDLMARAESLFASVREHLLPIDGVEAVRGRGGLIGVELDRPARPVVAALRNEGVLVGSSNEPHTLRLLPPLTMPLDGVEELATALATVLASA